LETMTRYAPQDYRGEHDPEGGWRPVDQNGIDPLPLRDWTAFKQAELEDQARYVNEYPLANLIMERPRRRLNYTTIFCIAVLALALLGALYGAGCFDRFITR
jgi:hypothetical protein